MAKKKVTKKVKAEVAVEAEVNYVGRRVSSVSEGNIEPDGTWKVITSMVEERLAEGSEKWEEVVFDVMIYGDTFAEAHHSSTMHLLNQVIALGAGEVISLFDLKGDPNLKFND